MWLNKLEQASATAHGYFTIGTRKREYQLTCENEITMQQWLDVIQPTRDAADVALAADLTADAVGAVGVYRHPDQCVIIGTYDPATGDSPASSSDEDVPWDTGVGHGKPTMPTLEHEGDETSPTRATHSRGGSLRGFLRRKTALGLSPRPKHSASGSPSHSASPQGGGGGGGGDGQPGSSALQQALLSMQAELRETKAKLRAKEQALSQETERTTDLSDTVDHLRHVIEAGGLGVAIPVDGNEQKSYQIECLRQQNQFMNVELLKMKAVIKTQNADSDELREAYDRANNIQVMLLGAVADAQDVETIKVRATELLQGTLSNAQSLSARVKRGSVHPGDSDMPGTNASYYDQWGFRVSHNLSAAYHTLKDQTSAVEKRTIHRWEAYLAHRPAAEVLPAKECPELKQLVRDGIPDRLRSQMWAEFVYMHTNAERRFKGQDYYANILEHKSGKTSVATKQIELDLMRTFPTHRDYHVVGSPKIASLRRILVAFSWHNPTIGYCQGLNMLGALALLFVDEETAFWALVAIVETIMPKRYFTRHMEASQADQRVLRELLHARCPKISAHLDKHEVDLSLITFNWMLVLFVECVPPATAIRIWDALLYEGSKIIFRVSLAVFITHQAEILKTHDRQELFDLIRGIPMRLYDSTALFKAAFHSLGGISGFSLQSKDIREKRAVKFEEVQQEMKELEERQRRYSMARSEAAAAREAEQAAARAPSPAEASGQVAGSVAPVSHPQPGGPGSPDRVPAPSHAATVAEDALSQSLP